MELILRSNQVVGEMKDIIYKCYRYRAESDTLRFTAYDKMASSRSKPARPDASKHGLLYVQVNMPSEKTLKAMKPTGPLHSIDQPDRRLLRQC